MFVAANPPRFRYRWEKLVALFETTIARFVALTPASKLKLDPVPDGFVPVKVCADVWSVTVVRQKHAAMNNGILAVMDEY